MRNPAPILILVISLLVGQTQSPELVEAGQLSEQVITLYKEGKYDTALPLAERALALREKVLGPDHLSTADALANLAQVYMAKGRRKEAKAYYQRAISIREKNPGGDNRVLGFLLERYVCLVAEEGQKDEMLEVRKRLFKLNNGIGYDEASHKATDLPAPRYPPEARLKKLSGIVVAKVTVDETGKVSEAKLLCGDPLLVKGVGYAVWNARFKPPTASGRPIKLIDLLIYHFVAN